MHFDSKINSLTINIIISTQYHSGTEKLTDGTRKDTQKMLYQYSALSRLLTKSKWFTSTY